MAALYQQMSPGRQLLGRIHPEHMGLHALLSARTQAKWKLRVQEGRSFSWARVDQSKVKKRKYEKNVDQMNENL